MAILALPSLEPISAPNALTPIDPLAPPYPLSHARILYDNLFDNAVVSIPAAQGITNPNTYERWIRSGSDLSITITQTSPQTIDAIAIGAHNLGTIGSTVTISTSAASTGTFTTRATLSPDDDKAIIVLLGSEITAQRIRITLGGLVLGAEIGVLYAGIALAMQRPIFGGHAPIHLNAETTYSNNASETGNWLGRTIVRNGYSTSYNWQFLTDDWYRDNFQPFVVTGRKKPFFIAWRPDLYPNETAYCWMTSDPKPSNRGGGTNYMEVSIDVQGYADR